MVSGIVYVFMGFVGVIGYEWLSLLIMEGPQPGIHSYRLFNYLSEFAENWLKGVYMCQDATCENISLPDHPFKNPNAPYLPIIE